MQRKLHVFRRALLGLAGLLAAGCLAGCGGRSSSFTWRAEWVPNNLDPQLAAESPEIIAVTHLFSGLYRLDAEGVPQPDCAESCTVSPDGRTWTFRLREGMRYLSRRGEDSGYAVTAEDFVFGLRRVFLPETGSPYARTLGGIRGSGDVLAGGDVSALGVRALDELTLEITLSEPDEAFLEKLCLPGAMPCDEEFFESTGGAYGLEMATTIGNGSFYLYNWTESGLFLRRAASDGQIGSLRIVLAENPVTAVPAGSGSEEEPAAAVPGPVQLVQDGKCDAALYEGPLGGTGLTELEYTTTVWALVFRCDADPLDNLQLRQALAAVAGGVRLELPDPCTPAAGLTPPDMDYGAGRTLPAPGDPSALYREALEGLGRAQVTGLTVLVPQGYAQLFGQVNQEWQRQLSLFCNVQELPPDELQARMAGGNYQIALVPLSPSGSDPLDLLEQLGRRGAAAYTDEALEEAFEALRGMPAGAARQAALAEAERALLAGCPAVPLFYQTKALLVTPEVSGIVFSPFAPSLDLTWAGRE